MIGRSVVIFQRGNNQNEIHEVDSWGLALSGTMEHESKLDEKIVAEASKNNWEPEEIVSDAEVDAIVNATQASREGYTGYHRWASDGVKVINLSGDPNLPNPAAVKAEKRRIVIEKRKKSLQKLDEFLPELMTLRNAIPTGKIILKIPIVLSLEVQYGVWESVSTVKAIDENGKHTMYASWLVDRQTIKELSEMASIVNCPHREAYKNKCREVAALLGLTETDVENAAYDVAPKGEIIHERLNAELNCIVKEHLK